MKAIATVFFAFLIPAACRADSLTVMGRVDCGAWVEARTAGAAGSAESLVQGVLNGLSFGTGVEFWSARGVPVSRASAMLWIDKYCHENPLSSADTGAIVLFEQNTGWHPKA